MRRLLPVCLGGAALCGLTVLAARRYHGWKHRVRSPAGIQEARYLPIGGIEQYIQIRGQDRNNPVLLFLHGGPGSPMAWEACAWQTALERRYTVVHWDQRGCGNTYFQNPKAERPTLGLLLSDLDGLMDALRERFRQERVLLMGHSWGTYLGAIYARKRPEKVTALVSVRWWIFAGRSRCPAGRPPAWPSRRGVRGMPGRSGGCWPSSWPAGSWTGQRPRGCWSCAV